MDIPTEWDFCVDSTYYHIHERFGFVMMWNNGHYHKSTKTEDGLIRASNPEDNTNDNKIYKIDIVRDTIQNEGPLLKADIQGLSKTKDSTCRESLRRLIIKGDIKLSSDGYYSYCGKTQQDLFPGS